MKNVAIVLVFIAATFAGCGGNDSAHHFQNQTAFESYIAGTLNTDVRDVHCIKTSTTTAECQTDLGTIKIKCGWVDDSGGHDCTLRRQG